MTHPPLIPSDPNTPAEPNAGKRKRPLDGVPHDIVGATALIAVLAALALGAAWVLGGPIAAGILAVILAPLIILMVSKRAAREREAKPASQQYRP